MSERKEPGLDPAGLESLVASGSRAAPPQGQVPAEKRGGSVLLTFILLLLAAGGGYLGYNLMQQQQQLLGLQAELAQARDRVESLESMLAVTSDSAEQSGQTLQQRLQDVDTRMTTRLTHVDAEIAKLWTIAYQRNKPQLEQHGEQLKALQLKLSTAENSLASVRAQVAKANEGVSQVATLKTEQAALKTAVQGRLGGVEKQLETLERSLKLESEGRLKIQKQLTEQLSGLSGGNDASAELAQRIRQNEQAIKAIDGTRRQLSQDLLRIRQQLNNLQLKLEQAG
ncbi:MAG: hypothetical protein GYB41_01130 [Oceanospirillales bacterium]|uniref:Uncharacterized protein n=1 Tax=Marinobacterium halophilum TaxID=267374 RepID=A0A2P8EYS5_9GAMM|nr:hypothetical protein [Marinobacterium halophilum]MBR9827250.1 hypothetical protein [Oceanospirillales bacterium]PSL14624.1 hypothetical protein CLV44_10775 [Marinobacterium halophilum]